MKWIDATEVVCFDRRRLVSLPFFFFHEIITSFDFARQKNQNNKSENDLLMYSVFHFIVYVLLYNMRVHIAYRAVIRRWFVVRFFA